MNRSILLALCLLIFALPAVAADLKEVADALRRDYPRLDFQQISPGPLEGIYQVVVSESEIVYYIPQKGYLLTGEFWTRDSHNLTREAKAELMTAKAGLFPLDKALVIGQGPNQVIEVVDPDCPYCREGSAFFAGRKDVTRYIFLYPLSIHPQAAQKAAYILSAKDKVAAYEEVMGGGFDDKPLPEFKDNGMLAEHQRIGEKVGIHGTPQYWVNGHYVPGANLQEITKMLGGSKP